MRIDESGHRATDDGFGRVRTGADHQLLLDTPWAAEQAVMQIVGQARDLARAPDQHAAQVRRHHAMAFTQEQRCADPRLQALDAARQRRLADVQGRRRAAEAAVFVQCEVHNVYRSPPSLQRQWAARSYHGAEVINSRGIINRFIGFWDGNPVNLEPLPQGESGRLYVEMMGGSAKILAKGRELIDQGKCLHAGEILNRLVFAEPGNQAARNLLADAFEQLGYQRESPSLRNSYLNMAYELRSGMQAGVAPSSTGPDVIRAMTTEQWLDFVGISVDS